METIRFIPDKEHGLTLKQVQNRIEQGLCNYDTSVPTKTIPRIIRDNFFTLFNFLNLFLGVLVFCTGSYKNLLFLGVVVCNTFISTFQEIRSKKTIDRLSVVASTKVHVIRGGKEEELGVNDLVLDDLVVYQLGNQVVVDSIVLEGECEVNEAFITGEVEPVVKKCGDMILSGSFIVSGKCKAYVEHIGNDNYTSQISSAAKYIKKIDSEMMKSLKQVIKWISICIVPIGLLLFWKQMSLDDSLSLSIIHTVAALIGMIPEGLILLTSTVLAVSVLRLSKENVLVQELYCIETLAYVDTLCLDKTGTITEGDMEVVKVISDHQSIDQEMNRFLTALHDDNATYQALRAYFKKEEHATIEAVYPFSSSRKWSGVTFKNGGSYVLGAPEIILNGQRIAGLTEYSKEYRVLALAKSNERFKGKALPNNLKLVALILLQDKIRSTAPATIAYFKDQGVDIKLISGDNVSTVSGIAKRVGITGRAIDATTLRTPEDIFNACEKYTIFGRVTPNQKKELVLALKKKGHKVAMTGDGVNDVLALKEADSSIAMSSGSDAARSVSQLVLLDSNFDAMPKVLAEGRRTINNIERSATLFLVKTIYSSILSVLFIFLPFSYPFMPIQMSLTSMFTIGIPSFFLALEPNKELVKGHFLRNVLKRALPAAIAIIIHVVLIASFGSMFHLTEAETSTLCVFTIGYIGFLLLYHLCKPFNWMRRLLYLTLIIAHILSFILFHNLFSLAPITFKLLFFMAVIAILGFLIFEINYYIYLKWFSKD